MVSDSTFAKTICSICYEDLKPIVEDLQSISICGHVFHELCLQQWFEYCSNEKKYSCPVCKQSCKSKEVNRLYFQSVGDPNDLATQRQKPIDWEEEDPQALRREVKRLETKVLGFSSVLERQGKDLKELNEELCICRGQAKKEEALKIEALKQKASMQYLLNLKSEELDKSTLECMRLQDRSLALAKELAAFKLISDLDVDEEEILKLTSFGNGANNKDTIDVLRKSLIMRNRSYKELMAKCNLLGRGEARFVKKYEKAKGKIHKLKERVQELETAVEVKDNEFLRALKASKKTSSEIQNSVKFNSNTKLAANVSSDHQGKKHSSTLHNSDLARTLANGTSSLKKRENFRSILNLDENCTESVTTLASNKETDAQLMDKNISNITEDVDALSSPNLEQQRTKDVTCDLEKEPTAHGTGNQIKIMASTTNVVNEGDDDMCMLVEDVKRVEPIFNIKKECPSLLPQSGNVCFSGGLIGPDGTNRYLGKWCKRGQNEGPGTGNLIAVGADGRGGRIKVLRSQDQPSLDVKEKPGGAKRCKHGVKTTNMPSQGCLQIEHFFGRVGR